MQVGQGRPGALCRRWPRGFRADTQARSLHLLDLKFHDIPNTVAGAVRSAASLGVSMLNVHASGGPAMLEAAREALAGIPDPPQLLAVTILTSMDSDQVGAVGIDRSPSRQVDLLARMSLAAGITGFVCSPQEVELQCARLPGQTVGAGDSRNSPRRI